MPAWLQQHLSRNAQVTWCTLLNSNWDLGGSYKVLWSSPRYSMAKPHAHSPSPKPRRCQGQLTVYGDMIDNAAYVSLTVWVCVTHYISYIRFQTVWQTWWNTSFNTYPFKNDSRKEHTYLHEIFGKSLHLFKVHLRTASKRSPLKFRSQKLHGQGNKNRPQGSSCHKEGETGLRHFMGYWVDIFALEYSGRRLGDTNSLEL